MNSNAISDVVGNGAKLLAAARKNKIAQNLSPTEIKSLTERGAFSENRRKAPAMPPPLIEQLAQGIVMRVFDGGFFYKLESRIEHAAGGRPDGIFSIYAFGEFETVPKFSPEGAGGG